MFTCRACLRRAYETSSRHGLPSNPNTSRYNISPFRAIAKPPRSNSRYATVAIHEPSADTANPIVATRPTDESRVQKVPPASRSIAWAARKELEYLADPLHIANRVRLALDKDNFGLAVVITRQASSTSSVTVSWNHLIDYELRNGRIRGALRFYNEMKKRAQQPNAQTFTIIFRGCAKSEHSQFALGEAVKLYQNMLSVGRIKPNTIHLNAILQVCAKAGDLDTMFSILSSADDPLRSPNNLTYTTILNAMRVAADREPPGGLEDKEVRREKQNTIKRAKAIWEEVISRWRSGSLIIDEELVCAMGRILLMGEYSDMDAIESLIEQTMMIPRADNKQLSKRGTKSAALTRPQPVIKAPNTPTITHALPGNNSLSMILEALENTRRTTKAVMYWNVFTLHHHVVPDAENWFRALRVYHRGKNSDRAATAVQHMPRDMLTPKHVRVAMRACLRDNLNQSALDNATKILKTMCQSLTTPDIQSLRSYVQVAHASRQSFVKENKHDYAVAIDLWAKKLTGALEHLVAPYQAVAKKYFIDVPNTSDLRVLGQLQNFKMEVVALARKMCAAYDVLTSVHETSLTTVQLKKIALVRADLAKLINDYYMRQRAGEESGE
ncbi:hypothetical protein F5Y12DRAFT_315094 [Xylaria sp. FL1777]|nr:hypothetical protein F5Y12DRAFT_315094 [Xylaria sp. FL1777]